MLKVQCKICKTFNEFFNFNSFKYISISFFKLNYYVLFRKLILVICINFAFFNNCSNSSSYNIRSDIYSDLIFFSILTYDEDNV